MIDILCAILIGVSIALLIERHLIRQLFGLILLGFTINFIILIAGGLSGQLPSFAQLTHSKLVNPLPQALILTAIVIGFALLAFLCVAARFYLKKTSKQGNVS